MKGTCNEQCCTNVVYRRGLCQWPNCGVYETARVMNTLTANRQNQKATHLN